MILALVDARYDPETQEFDETIAFAVADGRLDEKLARTLRWRQRESVRGVRDHLAEALPPLLEGLDAAAQRATGRTVRGGPEPMTPESERSADNMNGRYGDTLLGRRSTPASLVERRQVLVETLVAASGSLVDPQPDKGG
jgi:hypothetical protein